MDQHYIYVICANTESNLVKIGFSAQPEKRLKQLQTGQGIALVLFHKEEVPTESVRALERLIHKELRHKKSLGEWFSISPDDAVLEIKHALMRYGDLPNLSARIRARTI